MKILQLSPQFPLPADNGGKIGIYNIYKEFSEQGAEVIFVCYADNINDEQLKIAERYGKVYIIEHSTNNTPFRIFKSLLSYNPIYLAKHFNDKIQKELKLIIRSEKFHVIHADHSCMAEPAFFVKKFTRKPIGLRLHNIEYRIWQRYADVLPKYDLKRLYIQEQAEKLKEAEKKIYGNVDICFAITDNDRKHALDMNKQAKVKVASAGVNIDEWQVKDIQRDNNEMIIATTYDWVHNVDGAKWFVERVLPKIRKVIPDAYLTMIGKYLPDWFKTRKEQGINPVGYVDDVKPYLNKANIYIAPLFVGSGIRIKILEALAMELPVIATKVSAEGIKDNYANGIYVTNKSDEFAKIIIDLMQHPDTTREIGRTGRQFVGEEYTWKKNVGLMLNEYKKLI